MNHITRATKIRVLQLLSEEAITRDEAQIIIEKGIPHPGMMVYSDNGQPQSEAGRSIVELYQRIGEPIQIIEFQNVSEQYEIDEQGNSQLKSNNHGNTSKDRHKKSTFRTEIQG